MVSRLFSVFSVFRYLDFGKTEKPVFQKKPVFFDIPKNCLSLVPNCLTNVFIGKNAFFVRIGCCILGKSQPRVKDYTLGWNFQQFFLY